MTKTQYFGLAWMLYIIAVILINIMSLLLPKPMEPLEKYIAYAVPLVAALCIYLGGRKG